jgi:lipopolysaccharide biosynthesis glycosyltransferase
MKKELNILYTCDDAYLPLTGISIASVIENNKDTFITFYIATEDPDGVNFKKLCEFYRDNAWIRIRYLDCRKYDGLLREKGFDQWGSSSFYVYWKLFAYDRIAADHIWYLDSDVICMNEIDDPQIERAVGAVLDSAHADFNRLAHIDESYYLFNTGSLYVDVKKWKENYCTKKIVDHIEKMDHQPILCDQDILAAALQNDIEVIDPKYNFLTGYDYYGVHNSFRMYSLDRKPFYREEQIEEAKDHIIFYHCLGGVFGRPWERGNHSPVRKEFADYRELSAWPDYKTKRSFSLLFMAERMLEILPNGIYNRIHNLAQRMYLKKITKQ